MLTATLTKKLQDYQQNHLYRQRQLLSSPQSIFIINNGKKLLSFCSNDYLGLANDPRIIKALQLGAEKYGVGSGASQLITGHSEPHHILEKEFAEFLGFPRALLFSSGYMANVGVISALMDKKDIIFADKLNHASLLDGARLSGAHLKRYAHTNLAHLNSFITQSSLNTKKIIVTDSVFSMTGTRAPLSEISKTAQQHQTILMVDDAHAIGILGKEGRGSSEYFSLNTLQNTIIVCPLGKAFGSFGAIVVSNEMIIESLIQFARSYIYTTALPPSLACASLASLNIIRSEQWRREKLQSLIAYFKKSAAELNLPLLSSDTAIQVLLLGNAQQALTVSEQLATQGIAITAIRPPSVPPNSSRLRITLSSLHEQQHIDFLLEKLSRLYALLPK